MSLRQQHKALIDSQAYVRVDCKLPVLCKNYYRLYAVEKITYENNETFMVCSIEPDGVSRNIDLYMVTAFDSNGRRVSFQLATLDEKLHDLYRVKEKP